jgi:glutamate-ammonia-ligase adenylyltransferase
MAAASREYIETAIKALPAELEPSARLWLDRLLALQGHELLETARALSITDRILRLVAVSEFAAQTLLRHMGWFCAAARDGSLAAAPDSDAAEAVPDTDDTRFAAWLRERRNQVLLRILWRDLHGMAGTPETLTSLSSLADRLIVASACHARRRLAERYGELRGANGESLPLVILGMGKLGGRELNFSSDVDLIFLYPQEGESDGARVLGAQEYFTRMTRRVIALLEDVTADGFVYRVDTRLRPFGDSGPPVVSFAALESYLINHGRGWERYAYVKARMVSPPREIPALAALHTELIEPFVYRRYLDFGVFESLRDMKARIAAEVRRREMADNIKLGPGGIREIEFIVQSLQLVRGGSMRQLQGTSLRGALRQLMDSRGLARAAGRGLDDSYCFLRKVENMLQAIRDQQTHELPADGPDRARLVLAMGYADWEALAADIEKHRDFVNEQFAKVAFREDGDREDEPSSLIAAFATCCETDATLEEWQAVFDAFGYRDTREMATEMRGFLDARSTRQIDATASKRLYALLPTLLSHLQARDQPAVVLTRLLGILAQVLRRSAYVALLNENAAVLSRLTDLCERSAFLAEEIARFPLLLDEMLDPRLYSARLDAQLLRDDLRERLAGFAQDDSERQVEALAQFQRAALFRIAAADFSDQLPVMKVSDRLTDLAEIVLERALEIAWRDLTTRFGEPSFTEDGQERVAGLGVIAYGKLGGIELSYRSDLDLVFLHNSRGDEQHTRGPKSLDNNLFFIRLARRLVHFLTVQTGSGALYEVDTRLRPSGRSGLLVTSIEAFERYQTENAWTWEHQALLRARPVAGSASVAREFERIRAQTLKDRVNRASLRNDVASMREKMRAELDRSTAEVFDLKQGAGGIGDIEFLVQYLVLLHAARHMAVIHYSDNIRQLGTLGATGCMDAHDAAGLQDIYRHYRTRVHSLLLDERPALAGQDEFVDERAFVRDLWERTIA